MPALCLPVFFGFACCLASCSSSRVSFFLSLFLLCVHRTEPHKATRTVSTRGHVLVAGVLCVACLLCIRFVLFFLLFVFVLLPLQVEDSTFKCINVKIRYVLCAAFFCVFGCAVCLYMYMYRQACLLFYVLAILGRFYHFGGFVSFSGLVYLVAVAFLRLRWKGTTQFGCFCFLFVSFIFCLCC